jgi:hypothetical protein
MELVRAFELGLVEHVDRDHGVERFGRFVALHHGSRYRVGYFTSLRDAQTALDEVDDGSWQGIRNETTHERWWRQAGTWTGPHRHLEP